MNEIAELLSKLIMVPTQTMRATVESVDTDNWTATVTTVISGTERYNVRLRVVGDGKSFGIVVKPKKDSEVIIGIIENNPAVCYMVQVSEIELLRIEMDDKVLIEIPENGQVVMKARKVKFDGSNSGLILLQGILSRLNAIENAFNGHVHPYVSPSGAANTGTVPSPLQTTTENDLKSDEITWP
ncbi:MAG: hypothetical protein MH137_11120 [Flavobacteriales bacterium]|nr:hypothetical protein [Flavobacteriales bacterium]